MSKMVLKQQIIAAIGDNLCKIPDSLGHAKSRILSKRLVKHIVLSESELKQYRIKTDTNQPGCLMRILAQSEAGAKKLVQLLEKNKSNLSIQSISVIDTALDFPKHLSDGINFNHSVIVQLGIQSLFDSAISKGESLVPSTQLQTSILGLVPKSDNIVIDFSSPNIAKPFHLGHMKSTILGNYLANLLTFFGHKVTKLNYLGDWGTQYGLLSAGLREFGYYDKQPSGGDSGALRYLLDVYSKANQRGQEDPQFYDKAKSLFKSLDGGNDLELLVEWRHIRDLSLEELERAYSRLNIEFDVYDYESDYARSASKLVARLLERGQARVLPDGAVVAQMESLRGSSSGSSQDEASVREMCVPVAKSDGSSLYLSRDVLAAEHRWQRFQFDRMLYVVGSDQEKHFRCVQQLVAGLGHSWPGRLEHVKMGKLVGMSSRSGQFVLLSDMISEASRRYVEATRRTATSKVRTDDQLDEVGQQLALSALFVSDMRRKRTLNYKFDWGQVMEAGELSGVQLQTSYARLSSLLRQCGGGGGGAGAADGQLHGGAGEALACVEAANLVSCLSELDTALHCSYHALDPSHLVAHGLWLSKAANRARRSERLRVLGEPEPRKAAARLALFGAARQQLGLVIRLLGLKPLERV